MEYKDFIEVVTLDNETMMLNKRYIVKCEPINHGVQTDVYMDVNSNPGIETYYYSIKMPYSDFKKQLLTNSGVI